VPGKQGRVRNAARAYRKGTLRSTDVLRISIIQALSGWAAYSEGWGFKRTGTGRELEENKACEQRLVRVAALEGEGSYFESLSWSLSPPEDFARAAALIVTRSCGKVEAVGCGGCLEAAEDCSSVWKTAELPWTA